MADWDVQSTGTIFRPKLPSVVASPAVDPHTHTIVNPPLAGEQFAGDEQPVEPPVAATSGSGFTGGPADVAAQPTEQPPVELPAQPVAAPAQPPAAPERITAPRAVAPPAPPKNNAGIATKGLEWTVDKSGDLNAGQAAPPAAATPAPVAPAAGKKSGHVQYLRDSAAARGLDPDFVERLMSQESGGNPKAKSAAGARGLMQIMPSVFAKLGGKNIYDPQENADKGLDLLETLARKYDGDQTKIAAAYNAGEPAVDSYINGTVLEGKNPKGRVIESGVPPYRETQNYVKNVARPGQSAWLGGKPPARQAAPQQPPQATAPPTPEPGAPATPMQEAAQPPVADPRDAILHEEETKKRQDAMLNIVQRNLSAVGVGEEVISQVSGFVAAVPGFAAGIANAIINKDPQAYAEAFKLVQDHYTYEPRTESGKALHEKTAAVMELFSKLGEYVGEQAMSGDTESTVTDPETGAVLTAKGHRPDNPAVAALARAFIEGAPLLLGLKKPIGEGIGALAKERAPRPPPKTPIEQMQEVRPLKPKGAPELTAEGPLPEPVTVEAPTAPPEGAPPQAGSPGADVPYKNDPGVVRGNPALDTPPNVPSTRVTNDFSGPEPVSTVLPDEVTAAEKPPVAEQPVAPREAPPTQPAAQREQLGGRTEPLVGALPEEVGGRQEPAMGAETPVTAAKEPSVGALPEVTDRGRIEPQILAPGAEAVTPKAPEPSPDSTVHASVLDIYERDRQAGVGEPERLPPSEYEPEETGKTVQTTRRVDKIMSEYNAAMDKIWDRHGTVDVEKGVRYLSDEKRALFERDQRVARDRLVRQIEKLRADLEERALRRSEKQLDEALHKDYARGPAWVRRKLEDARVDSPTRNAGSLPTETVDLALWLLDKNPRLATDLAISITKQVRVGGQRVAGSYTPLDRIIRLSKEDATPDVAVHEILHHTERMLPDGIREGIRKEWANAIANEMATAQKAGDMPRARALEEMVKAMDGDRVAQKLVADLFARGVLKADRDYQLVNPSEFWAVNGSRILSGRHAAGTWMAKAKQWWKEFVEKLKSLVGGRSDAPVIRALDNLMRSSGEQIQRTSIHQGAGLYGSDAASIVSRAREAGKTLSEKARELGEDFLLKTTPMVLGSKRAMALAKDYANAERRAAAQWYRFDAILETSFTKAEREAMGRALDEQSVLEQQGLPTAGRGLDTLTPEQRAQVDLLAQHGAELWQEAKDVGILAEDAQQLPHYMPRMLVDMAENGKIGRYRGGEGAQLVQDIRALPMALARFERAIAGRRLINSIKEIGDRLGETLVDDGTGGNISTTTPNLKFRKHLTADETLEAARARDRLDDSNSFTRPEPAFQRWQPRFIRDEEGKIVPAVDQNGNMLFDRVPIRIANEFKGPLEAIARSKPGAVYKSLMDLKGKSMGVIMYSPLIHNIVEYGRALPAMPGKVWYGKIYFEGNKAKNDIATMLRAIDHGLVPIGKRGFMQDITGIAEDPSLQVGRSWTAKAIGGPVGLANERAGLAVKGAIDKAGDFYHNTLLWDRIADLQMGLFVNFEKSLVKKLDPQSASRMAADWANRFSGAMPNEAMSEMARRVFNVVLFSRTFTLGNVAVFKNMFTGAPKDVLAQIERDAGTLMRNKAARIGRIKHIQAYMADLALFYAANSLFQDAIDHWRRDKSWSQIGQDYVNRLHELVSRVHESPFDVLQSPFESIESLTSTGQNEPGKEGRLFLDTESSGQGIYLRSPLGKVGEELHDWTTSPIATLKRKEGTIVKPLTEIMVNDRGYGRHVYDPMDESAAGLARAAGNIVMHIFQANVPAEAIQSLYRYATDVNPKKMDLAKAVGPLAGITVSRGHPGGPEAGVLANAKKAYEFRREAAMPSIRHWIDNDDLDKAIEKMDEIGMPPAEQRNVLRGAREGVSGRQLREFENYATPDQQQKLRDVQQ